MPTFFIRLVILALVLSCTKKKEEPVVEQPAPTQPAKKSMEPPQDKLHQTMKFEVDENGGMFEKKKKNPIAIMKLQAIKNAKSQHTKDKFNKDKAFKLYTAHCKRCHGENGEGDGPEARRLAIAPTNFKEWDLKYGSELEELVYSTTYGQGEGEMPGYRNELSEAEIWLVSRLVKEWIP